MAGPSVERQEEVLAVLAHGRHGPKRRAWRIAVGALLIVVMTCLALAAQVLIIWNNLRTTNWDFYDESLTIAAVALFAEIMAFVLVFDPLRKAFPAAAILRATASVGGDGAPAALVQPEPLAGVDIPLGPARFTVPQANRGVIQTLRVWLIVLQFLAVLTGPASFVVGDAFHDIDWGAVRQTFGFAPPSVPQAIWQAGGIALVVLLVGVTVSCIVILVREARRLIVTADELGVHWRRGGLIRRQASIAWHDVHAFYMVNHVGAGSASRGQRSLYVLDGGERGLLTWAQQSPMGFSESARAERRRIEHQRLCRLIVTRTGRPLLDLTRLAEKLAAGVPESADAPAMTLAAPLAIPSASQPTRGRGWRIAAIVCLLVVPYVLGAAVYAGGLELQQRQQKALAALPARLHATTPLYADALSGPDADWAEHTPETGNLVSANFSNGALHMMSASGLTANYWQPRAYTDAAVEVTVRQYGSSWGGSGSGLLLREQNDGDAFVTFMVDSATGDWSLWSFSYGHLNADDDWNYLTGDQSGAIVVGEGNANRLLAVMHGSTYLFYINDQLVGSYTDGAHTTAHGGPVGVYVDDGSTEGIFSNFAVYSIAGDPAFALG